MIHRDEVIRNGVIGGLIAGVLSAIVCLLFSIVSSIFDFLGSILDFCTCCCIFGLIFKFVIGLILKFGSAGIGSLAGIIGGFISAFLLKKTLIGEKEFLKNSVISGSVAGFIVGIMSAIATVILSFISGLYALGIESSEDKAVSALFGMAVMVGLIDEIIFFILIVILSTVGGLIGGIIGGAIYNSKLKEKKQLPK